MRSPGVPSRVSPHPTRTTIATIFMQTLITGSMCQSITHVPQTENKLAPSFPRCVQHRAPPGAQHEVANLGRYIMGHGVNQGWGEGGGDRKGSPEGLLSHRNAICCTSLRVSRCLGCFILLRGSRCLGRRAGPVIKLIKTAWLIAEL